VREIRRTLFFESGAAKIQANQRRFDEAVESIDNSVMAGIWLDDQSSAIPPVNPGEPTLR
jgi:hypothetical protein